MEVHRSPAARPRLGRIHGCLNPRPVYSISRISVGISCDNEASVCAQSLVRRSNDVSAKTQGYEGTLCTYTHTYIGAAWPWPLEIAILACAAPGDWPAIACTNIAIRLRRVCKYDQWGPRHDSGDGSASTAAGTLHLTRLRRHADMIARAASYCILNCISLTPTASRTQGTASPLEAPRVPSQHSAHDAVRRPVLRDAQRAAQHTPQKRARAQATAGEVRF